MVSRDENGNLVYDNSCDASLWGLFAFGLYDANDERIISTMKALKDKLYNGVINYWTGKWFGRGITDKGEKVGMIKVKQFRPFPCEQLVELCRSASRIGVLDRNYSAGTGGIFWQEVKSCMQGQGEQMIQGYLLGVGGGDVVPETIREVVDDLGNRNAVASPIWKGIEQ